MAQKSPVIVQGEIVQEDHKTAEAVTGVPLYKDGSPQSGTNRFVVKGYQDLWAIFAFGTAVAITVIWGLVNFLHAPAANLDAEKSEATKDIQQTQTQLAFTLLYLVLACSLSSVACIAILCKWPRQSIIGANVLCGVIYVIAAIVAFANKSVLMGCLYLLIGGMQLLWLYLVRNRIPFAALLLHISTTIVSKYKAVVAVNFLMVAVFAFYSVFFGFMAYPASLRAQDHSATDYDGALITLYALLFFWTSQVVLNVMHVTSAGLVATWYFVGGLENMPSNPTGASFVRAMTTSFGSICFGSLIVAIIKTLRFLADMNRENDDSFVACVLQCLARILEQLMEYFNQYAFVHVAIYGCSYIEAAKKTWELAKNCGFSAWFNDCLVQPTLFLVALGISFLVAIISWIIGGLAMAVLAFMVSFTVHMVMLKCVESAVMTIFVCFAEVPAALANASPELYEMLHGADHGVNQV